MLLKLMAPITSFLSEEAYGFFKGKSTDSVFLESYPTLPSEWKNPKLAETFEICLKVRSEVQKKLEELRAAKVIGASLEAYVEISADETTYAALQSLQDLREFLIVSKVKLTKGEPLIEVKKADGEKCERCWTYSTEIGKHSTHSTICPKCIEALT